MKLKMQLDLGMIKEEDYEEIMKERKGAKNR
jgi:hypothetical protein